MEDISSMQQGAAPSSSRDLNPYVAARNARDPYGDGSASAYGARDPYDAGPMPQSGRNRMPPPPPPSWGGAQPSEAELLAEYGTGTAATSVPGRTMGSFSGPTRYGADQATSYPDPYSQTSMNQTFDPDDEQVQAIKYQIRNTKQESLSSTRNALRLARETEETATNTMVKLGEQSGASFVSD